MSLQQLTARTGHAQPRRGPGPQGTAPGQGRGPALGVRRGDINETSLCDVITMGKIELAGEGCKPGETGRDGRAAPQVTKMGEKRMKRGRNGWPHSTALPQTPLCGICLCLPWQVLGTKDTESSSRLETQPPALMGRQGEALPDPVSPVPPTIGTAAPRCPTCPRLGARTRRRQGQGAVSPRPSLPAKGTFLLLPSPG